MDTQVWVWLATIVIMGAFVAFGVAVGWSAAKKHYLKPPPPFQPIYHAGKWRVADDKSVPLVDDATSEEGARSLATLMNIAWERGRNSK